MRANNTVIRCLGCGKPLTFAEWFSGDCPATDGLGPIGHQPPIPGALLPISPPAKEEDEAQEGP